MGEGLVFNQRKESSLQLSSWSKLAHNERTPFFRRERSNDKLISWWIWPKMHLFQCQYFSWAGQINQLVLNIQLHTSPRRRSDTQCQRWQHNNTIDIRTNIASQCIFWLSHVNSTHNIRWHWERDLDTASVHKHLLHSILTCCQCSRVPHSVYFLQKYLQFKSTTDRGRLLYKTVRCFCIIQTPNWCCRRQSPPLVPPTVTKLPIRGQGLTERAHWFGLSWYVVQCSSPRMTVSPQLHLVCVF